MLDTFQGSGSNFIKTSGTVHLNCCKIQSLLCLNRFRLELFRFGRKIRTGRFERSYVRRRKDLLHDCKEFACANCVAYCHPPGTPSRAP